MIGSDAGPRAKGMKDLHLPLVSSPSSPLSPTPSLPSSSLSTASSSSSEDLLAVAGPADHLDSFLQEALNSRNRITVLRLEQEIEKFAGNSKQQQLLLRPMLSSYERLTAHRVAQYYHLQSMAVESNGPSGSRILLLKTPDSTVPSVRLVDIPIDPTLTEKFASPALEKVAIKRRTSGTFNMNDAGAAGRITPLKSVEERTEEYNKARARIFSNGDLANGKDSRADAVSREDQHISRDSVMPREVTSIGAERDNHEDEAAFTAANRVAVFRDREKDTKDPDYDRSYGRYSPPLNAGIVTNVKPLITHGVCSSSNGMLCQRGISNLQTRVDSVFYPASDNQDGSWVGLAGLPVLGYPCAMPCSQGHSLSNMYPPTQRLVHPGYHGFANWRQLPTKIEPHPMASTQWFRSY